ncbi:MAG: hypothetical protein H7Z41_09595, partial [Cytophagales bacterium]|nr:hypothetical protein [Armatimonadota bacterium]
ADGRDTTPQIYVVRNGKRLTILCGNDRFTGSNSIPDPEWRVPPAQMVYALARLAADLRRGNRTLLPAQAISLSEATPAPEPLQTRLALGDGIAPEGAVPLIRWGRFDGSGADLGQPVAAKGSLVVPVASRGRDAIRLPRALQPGATVHLLLPPATLRAKTPRFLRIRGAYGADDAALSVAMGQQVVLSERFVYEDMGGQGNFGAPDLAGIPVEFNRIVYLPPPPPGATAELTVSNPGVAPIYFDALQIETHLKPAPQRVLGLGSGFASSYPNGSNPIPPDLSKRWSVLRISARTQYVGPPGDPKRWAKLDDILNRAAAANSRLQVILEGTPAWAAISPERLELAKKAKRAHTVPPDPAKYAEIVTGLIARYGDRIDSYEIWNEADIQQFFRGSTQEYIALFQTVVPIVRRLDPSAEIFTTGMAGFKEAFVADLVRAGILRAADRFAFHPYAGKSPAWDVPMGLVEGSLMASGVAIPLYANESGFVWKNAEWFQPPPQFTPQVQEARL